METWMITVIIAIIFLLPLYLAIGLYISIGIIVEISNKLDKKVFKLFCTFFWPIVILILFISVPYLMIYSIIKGDI